MSLLVTWAIAIGVPLAIVILGLVVAPWLDAAAARTSLLDHDKPYRPEMFGLINAPCANKKIYDANGDWHWEVLYGKDV